MNQGAVAALKAFRVWWGWYTYTYSFPISYTLKFFFFNVLDKGREQELYLTGWVWSIGGKFHK